MTTIDQRILIPTSPNIIWDYISNLSNNPKWQFGCRSVAFITTFHQGQGTRWRYTGAGRKEYVAEVTAWYDRLGYEYRIVDGVPYKENRGRIRLQETPEGTIVQWTFSYELGGALSGFRNALGVRRNVESMIIESLWELWRKTSKSGQSAAAPFTAKSLMQDAPDVQKRSEYKPRHPSVLEQDNLHARLAAEEPPVIEGDTRPRVAAPGLPEVQPAAAEPEPDFLAGIPESPAATDVRTSTETPAFTPDDSWWQRREPETTKSASVATEIEQETSPVEHTPWKPVPVDEDNTQPAAESQSTAATTASDYVLEPLPSKNPALDTSQLSVFDLFGLPKPSETQEMAPVQVSSLITEKTPPVPVKTEKLLYHRGLRAELRRKIISVRLRN
ncbi:MAG: hypothetical protein OHK0046_07180 [Anaerolineae bacterium]